MDKIITTDDIHKIIRNKIDKGIYSCAELGEDNKKYKQTVL